MAKPKFMWFPTVYPMQRMHLVFNPHSTKAAMAPPNPSDPNHNTEASHVVAYDRDQATRMMELRGLGERFRDPEAGFVHGYMKSRVIRRDTMRNCYWRKLSNRIGGGEYSYSTAADYWNVRHMILIALHMGTYTWQELLGSNGLLEVASTRSGFNQKMVDYIHGIEASIPGITLEYAEKFYANPV